MVSEEVEQELKEFTWRGNVLETLLVSSMIEDNFMFPTIKEFILSEVVNGTIDYIGGYRGLVEYRKFDTFNRNLFEKEIWNYFEYQLNNSQKILNRSIKNAITDIVKPYAIDTVGSYTELYNHFRDPFGDGICRNIIGRIFSLPYVVVYNVQKRVLPNLSESEKRDIKGIGKRMRDYINGDLDYIRKEYRR